MRGHVFDVLVGSFDSDAQLHCLNCLDESDQCGWAFRLGFDVGDSTECTVCGVDVVAAAGDVVGFRSVVHSDVLLCQSCFVDVCDDRVKGDHKVVLRSTVLAMPETDRVCACCRELVCS